MSTRRFTAAVCAVLGAIGIATVSPVAGQQASSPMAGHDMPMPGQSSTKAAPSAVTRMTNAEKITNAMSAAPSSVSAEATILDWPDSEGAMPSVIRQGTNGWRCFPDMRESPGNDPMCVDETWMTWLEAYISHKVPMIARVGVAYMLAPGGGWASNSDPYAMHETAGNHWSHHDPHMMIVVPDPRSLAGISTDPKNGGPYVMWAGTPYAHIMAPADAASKARSSVR